MVIQNRPGASGHPLDLKLICFDDENLICLGLLLEEEPMAGSIKLINKRIISVGFWDSGRFPLSKTTPSASVFTRLSSTLTDFRSDDYQFLEKSKTPTYHFQPGLMRLPIPKLEKTCERYLTGIRPFLSEAQHAQAAKLSKEFMENQGPELQKQLIAYDKLNDHTNYVSETWFDIYLRSRVCIAIHYNPAIAFAFDPDKKYNDPLTRATNMIVSIGRFKRSLDAELLSPEVFHLNPKKSDTDTFRTVTRFTPRKLSWIVAAFVFKAFALDMSQHPFLFNTTRIPHQAKDEIRRDPSGKHFIMMRKGHFFAITLFHPDGSLVSPSELHASLAHVMNLPLENASDPLGLLTTKDRDKWVLDRNQLLHFSPENQALLEKIDRALFCFCLDDFQSTEPRPIVKNLLHSDGTNRWFDKSLSLIMHSDGLTAVNFEHAWGDGVPVLRLMEEIFRDSCRNHWVHPETKPDDRVDTSKFVEKIELKLSKNLKNEIKEAREDYKKLCDSIDFSTLEYMKMNRDYIKGHKLSPDAVIQLAIQIGFYRQYGKTPCTYESCSTAVYKHGRTEAMRPATSDTKRCVQAFLSKEKPPVQELRRLINQCSKTHGQLVKEASMGQGFDRHLLGLRTTSERIGQKLPALFTDGTFKAATTFTVSTSTLSTDTIILGAFGPVVPDGYGVGYNVSKDRMGMIVSGYPPAREPREFVKCVEQSLEEIYEVLEHTKAE